MYTFRRFCCVRPEQLTYRRKDGFLSETICDTLSHWKSVICFTQKSKKFLTNDRIIVEAKNANHVELKIEALTSRDISFVTEEYVPQRLKEQQFLD